MEAQIRKYVQTLLANYPQYVRQIALLRNELENTQKISQDDIIVAMAFSRGEGVNTAAGHITDKTQSIALNYRQRAAALNQETVSSIVQQLELLMRKTNRLEYCVAHLSNDRSTVIRGIYFENKTPQELAYEMCISTRTLQRHRERAIEELTSMYEELKDVGVNLDQAI